MRTLLLGLLALALIGVPAAADPGKTRVSNFSSKGSVKEAIARLSKMTGIAIEFAPGVQEKMAVRLGQPIRMVIRSTTVDRLLRIFLTGSKMTHVVKGPKKIEIQIVDGPVGEGVGEGIAKIEGGPDAVLVVEFVRRQRIFASGTIGANYWFKVLSVKRFDRTTKVAKHRQSSYQREFSELKKRSLTLARSFQLECAVTYRGAGVVEKAKLAHLDKLLKPGAKYVLAASTTVVFSTLGTVVDNKWGAVRGLGTHIFKHSDKALGSIDVLFGMARKAAPAEELDVTAAPRPPR